MATVKLPGSERFDTQTEVQTSTQNGEVSLALEFQTQLSNASCKHGILDHGKKVKKVK